MNLINPPGGFVYATCETCELEGMFPDSLICPNCGEGVEKYVVLSAAELAALRQRVSELEAARADRYFACTYCGLMLPYNGNNPGERERIGAEMDEHAAKCECDPKNQRIAELEAFVAEWSSRFGFLATEHPRDSIESIDEVAELLGKTMKGGAE